MRLLRLAIVTPILVGCVTQAPEGPVNAQTVNAEMEEAIVASVQAGKDRGAPNLSEIRTEGPAVPGEKERQQQATSLATRAEGLKETLAADRAAVEADRQDAEAAKTLRAKIARDRAAAAAEAAKRPGTAPQ